MNFYCTEEFKNQYEKLLKKKSYRNDLPPHFIKKILESTADQLYGLSVKLNASKHASYLKTRIGGSGGYRAYSLLVVSGDNVYLGFVHPKTGTYGADNISDKEKDRILEEMKSAAKDGNLYQVTATESGQLAFQHLSELKGN